MRKGLQLLEEYEDLCEVFPDTFNAPENLGKKEKFQNSVWEIRDQLNVYVVQQMQHRNNSEEDTKGDDNT